MEPDRRKENLAVFSKIFIFFALAVYLSRVFFDYAYMALLYRGAWNPNMRLGPNINIFPKIAADRIFYFGISVLVIVLCVWGLISMAKKKNYTKYIIMGIGAMPLTEVLMVLYVAVRSLIAGLKWGAPLNRILSSKYFANLLVERFLSLSVLVFSVILIAAYLKKPKHKQEAVKNNKQGLGGFFVIPMIRNIVMPLNSIGIFAAIILSLFNSRILRDFTLSNIYASRMLFVILLLSVLGIMAIIKMFKKDGKFIPMILSVEIMALVQYMQNLIQSIFARTGGQMNLTGSIPYIIISALLIIYYIKSGRVKNTYKIDTKS